MLQWLRMLWLIQETQILSLCQEDLLEKEIATHFSSILAWEIPWTEEPGGLQSMGSQSWTWLSDWTATNNSLITRMCIYFPSKNGTWVELILSTETLESSSVSLSTIPEHENSGSQSCSNLESFCNLMYYPHHWNSYFFIEKSHKAQF